MLWTSAIITSGPPLVGIVDGNCHLNLLSASRGLDAGWVGPSRSLMAFDRPSAVASTTFFLPRSGDAESTATRVALSPSAVMMAVTSPKASWNEPTSRKLALQKLGRAALSTAWPHSWATTSVLSPE